MADLEHNGVKRDLPERYQPTVIGPVGSRPHRVFPDEDDSASLHHYLAVLRRRKWVIAAVVVASLILTAIQVFTATPLYVASTTLQIDPEADNVLPYQQVSGAPQQLQRGEYLSTQTEKLKTRSLSLRVVEQLQMKDDPRFDEVPSRGALREIAATVRGTLSSLLRGGSGGDETVSDGVRADQLLADLEVSPLRSTRLIRVRFGSADPELSATVVNAFAEQFIEQHLESKFDATFRATEFLREQLLDLKLRVERSEEELLSYARAKNIVNYDEHESISRKKLADLSDESTRVETELIGLAARYRAAQNATGSTVPELLKNDRLRTLEGRLADLEQQLAGLEGQFGPQWQEVKDLKLTVEALRVQIGEEQTHLIDSAKREYLVAADRKEQLTGSVNEQRTQVDRLNEDSIQYRILKREVDTNKELYEGLLQRLKEAGVAAGLRSSNIQVVDAASAPRFASSPQRAKSLGLALFMGLLVGLGCAFLIEALDNTLRTTDEVMDYVGLPSLGVVPHMRDALAIAGRGHLRLSGKAGAEPRLAFSATEASHDRASEAFRSLRTSILLSHASKPPETLLITSAMPNEGKSTAAANVAIALAQSGTPTVLVDLDLRRPSLAGLFGIPGEEEGVSSYLSGDSELLQVRRTRFEKLFLAPSGPIASNPAELLGSPKLAAALNMLGGNFAHVVIDAPPCLELTDALLIASQVDGVILVVRSGRTHREAVRRAGQQIQRVGGQLLGVLINDVDSSGSAEDYYYEASGSYFDQFSGKSSDAKSSS